jgi:glycosyltransferase involved in cell wall biosynthesis
MAKRKVLFVCHNHPELLVGGVEMYVHDLYQALAQTSDFEPMLLARAGRPFTSTDAYHDDTPFTGVNEDPNQYLMYTDLNDFDYFYGRLTASRKAITKSFTEFLEAHRPDVVHFQHTAYMGYDLVTMTRNALPSVPIVYSLHDYMPICHRDGQMVRAMNNQLCQEESPRRCHECFPEISPQTFFMRKRFVQSHFSLVDRIIVPSEYVKERYVDWGIPDSKMVVEPQGHVPAGETAEATEPDPAGPESRRASFGYFGQLNPYKGSDVLLEAMQILGSEFDGELWVFGANLDKQSPDFRERLEDLIGAEQGKVKFVGPYDRVDLPKLMRKIDWVVVPSIWWETGPLTVWEAFDQRRPVICSDIGGMSEKVTDGVNGLHFRTGDARDLADTMRRAAETPGLWEALRAGIPPNPGHPMAQHIQALTGLYAELLTEHAAGVSREPNLVEVASA